MSLPTPITPAGDSVEWYCVRAQVKREHIAAAELKQLQVPEVFCPRVRLKRPTPRGAVWFIEALFPGYLFARFNLRDQRRAVEGCRGVRGVVHFGDNCVPVPDAVIAQLYEFMAGQEIKVVDPELRLGDEVVITEGAMRGQSGILYELAPGAERVRVLLEMLGQTRPIEVGLSGILRAKRAS